jgi:hypothetical protein
MIVDFRFTEYIKLLKGIHHLSFVSNVNSLHFVLHWTDGISIYSVKRKSTVRLTRRKRITRERKMDEGAWAVKKPPRKLLHLRIRGRLPVVGL